MYNMEPTPPISPIRAQLNQFRVERENRMEAVLSDDGEHLRHAIENNSWLLARRLVDVPNSHAECDGIYPRGVISPVDVLALKEIDKRGWTILHCLCFHGAPASLIVHTITRLLTEDEDRSSDDDPDDEEEEEQINWNDDDSDEESNKKSKEKDMAEEEEEEEEEEEPHPVSMVDDLKNNLLHLLFARSTKDGDGTKGARAGENKNVYNIVTTILTFDKSLARAKNLNGHTPLHSLLASTGAGGRINVKLLLLLKQCHPLLVEDLDPFQKLPLHIICTLNSPIDILQLMLQWYPLGARALDGKGRTPLHCAMMLREPKILVIQLLLQCYPFAVNIVDSLGRTPLLTSVVTCGPDHPPPESLLNLLKSQSEWYHPEHQIYRSFEWYASGTKAHPHVWGCDFDNIDVTTPAVKISVRIPIKEKSKEDVEMEKIYDPKNPRAKVQHVVRNRLPKEFNKQFLNLLSGHGDRQVHPVDNETFLGEIAHPIKQTFRWYEKGNTCGPDFLGNMKMDGEHAILKNVVDQYDVDSAIRTENLALKSGDRRSIPEFTQQSIQQSTQQSTQPGVSVLSMSSSSPRRNQRRSPRRGTSRSLQSPHASPRGSPRGSPNMSAPTRPSPIRMSPTRPSPRKQLPGTARHQFLSSTVSGQRRVDAICEMGLSAKHTEALTRRALASRDFDRSTLRSHQMTHSLRTKYYKQPVLLRTETPTKKKDYVLNLPEVVVDAREPTTDSRM